MKIIFDVYTTSSMNGTRTMLCPVPSAVYGFGCRAVFTKREIFLGGGTVFVYSDIASAHSSLQHCSSTPTIEYNIDNV